MGLFSRRSREKRTGADGAPPEAAAGEGPPVELPEDGRPVSAPLSEAERSRIARGLAALAQRGIDVDDLGAVGAAYDLAFAEHRGGAGQSAAEVVELFGIAIGEHLVRHSTRSWAVVTDVFGTDLGLRDARGETVIVPHNLVSARWMREETGWIPGVVGHLVTLRPRAVRPRNDT
ncbi:MAG TPA: DUF3806 domain-containing protein [Intrasporangium sp.]|uniref:DUF3806 domain-containing protein n=1 Tax=Intrasporangium sp. TaxID=1925024 RepID=UPI002B465F42|nr:DUF3806 domain-containing protein [Intrasporangium sp.]HKX69153.1 DUF3806 domain-containing protein [Intrasporangium sp.]